MVKYLISERFSIHLD